MQIEFAGVSVALFTRAWIEIDFKNLATSERIVALFTRAWIEIKFCANRVCGGERRPLHEGVD